MGKLEKDRTKLTDAAGTCRPMCDYIDFNYFFLILERQHT